MNYSASAPAAAGEGNSKGSGAKRSVYEPYNSRYDAAYRRALQKLLSAENAAPSYTPQYEDELAALRKQIGSRESFSYDAMSDPLYLTSREQYLRDGELAMRDAMGRSAALTGGYGSSYGESVGQQSYNDYLRKLNASLPEYYDRAYQRYQGEGEALRSQYDMTLDAADREYDRYSDAYDRYLAERAYASEAEDTAYRRGAEDWERRYGVENDLYERAYTEEKDAYARLLTLITDYGYDPTDEEIAAAGLTREMVDAMLPKASSSHAYTGGSSPARYSDYMDYAVDARLTGKTSDINSVLQKGVKEGNITSEQAKTIMAASRDEAFEKKGITKPSTKTVTYSATGSGAAKRMTK